MATDQPAVTLLAKRRATMAEWRASLSPAEAEEFEAAKAVFQAERDRRRAARAARLLAREAFERSVVEHVLRGFSTDEISAETNSTPREVRRVAARLGIARMAPGYRRLPVIQIPRATREQIEAIAALRGSSAAETVAALLIYAFEEGGLHARRLLRVAPTR